MYRSFQQILYGQMPLTDSNINLQIFPNYINVNALEQIVINLNDKKHNGKIPWITMKQHNLQITNCYRYLWDFSIMFFIFSINVKRN
jgi:hypothetical protein